MYLKVSPKKPLVNAFIRDLATGAVCNIRTKCC